MKLTELHGIIPETHRNPQPLDRGGQAGLRPKSVFLLRVSPISVSIGLKITFTDCIPFPAVTWFGNSVRAFIGGNEPIFSRPHSCGRLVRRLFSSH
jgi:hypothetical protein